MSKKQATLELGIKPIAPLLLQYALPAIVAMVASSLYNMVDSIFIGQGVGAMAISGLAITFPFMNLSAAFGAAIGIGSSTLLSVKLGQRDYGIANKILGNCIMLNLIMGILFGGICLVFLDPILRFFGASDQTLPYAREYMQIILIGNVATHLYLGLNAMLRAVSKPKAAMVITIFTVILNVILDPLFIYALGLGIRGAAIATILSQLVALALQWFIFSNKNELLHIERNNLHIVGDIVRNIIGIGISPFAMNATACFVVIFLNNSLAIYGGDLAVGAYGIANRIAFIFVMITFGVCQGMQPIAGYNFGAHNYARMLEVLRLSITAGVSVCTVGFLVAMLLPDVCAGMFTTDEQLIAIAITAIRTMMLMFIPVGAQIVITNFFQSIGKAKISIILSLSRQLLFLVPLLYILPLYMGIDGVWAAMPISDAFASVIAISMLIYYYRRFHRKAIVTT